MDGGGVDDISSLPNDVLISIISCLPFHDAVRTGVLSSRWKKLWTHATPCIDDSSLRMPASAAARGVSHEDWLAGVVRSILADYKGPIQICRLHTFLGASFSHCIETICGRDGLKELELNGAPDNIMQLPEAVIRCQSLTLLKLIYFYMNDFSLSEAPRFVNLKKLDLCYVRLSDESINAMLNGCRVLDELCLRFFVGLKSLKICLPSLKKLVIKCPKPPTYHYKEYIRSPIHELWCAIVTIEDAPNLEELLIDQYFTVCTPLTVRHAPKLRIIGLLSMDTQELDLCGNTFKTSRSGEMIESSVTLLPNIKYIGVKVNPSFPSHIRKMLHLLRCCPCLEKLDIEFDDLHSYNTRRGLSFPLREEAHFNCLEYHLTKVRISGFKDRKSEKKGQKKHMKIINFLISNAKVFKLMDLKYKCYLEDEWLIAMKRILGAKKTASPELKICLGKGHYRERPLDPWDL